MKDRLFKKGPNPFECLPTTDEADDNDDLGILPFPSSCQSYASQSAPTPNLEALQKYKFDNFALPENPSNQKVADFYDAFIGVLLSYSCPALQRSNLKKHGIAHPQNHSLSLDILCHVALIVQQKLTVAVGLLCTKTCNIIKESSSIQDGY